MCVPFSFFGYIWWLVRLQAYIIWLFLRKSLVSHKVVQKKPQLTSSMSWSWWKDFPSQKKATSLSGKKKPQLTSIESCSWWKVSHHHKKSHKSYFPNPTLRYNFLKQKPVEPDPPCLNFCNFYLHLHAWRNSRHRKKKKKKN